LQAGIPSILTELLKPLIQSALKRLTEKKQRDIAEVRELVQLGRDVVALLTELDTLAKNMGYKEGVKPLIEIIGLMIKASESQAKHPDSN